MHGFKLTHRIDAGITVFPKPKLTAITNWRPSKEDEPISGIWDIITADVSSQHTFLLLVQKRHTLVHKLHIAQFNTSTLSFINTVIQGSSRIPTLFPKNFPRPPRIIFHDCTMSRTIFYFYRITGIRNIKFYQLQTIHPIYYITLTKMDCQLTSKMSLVNS